MKRLAVASMNTGKVREIRAALAGLAEWSVEPLPAGLPQAEETGTTFLENASQKAEFYSRWMIGWTVADDSGLVVDALGGRPGIYSARYAPTDSERNLKLIGELKGVPEEERTAQFVSALAVAHRGEVIWTVEQRVAGRIATAPKGEKGWGYDPIFWLPDFGRTMGELEPEVKNRISHRGRALARLREYLETFKREDVI